MLPFAKGIGSTHAKKVQTEFTSGCPLLVNMSSYNGAVTVIVITVIYSYICIDIVAA